MRFVIHKIVKRIQGYSKIDIKLNGNDKLYLRIGVITISGIISVILLALFWFLGKPIISVFVEDTAITSTAVIGIRISSLFFMGLGLNQIFRYMFSCAGDANFALVNGIVEVVSRIVLAVALPAIPFIGMCGIWLTNGLAWLFTCAFAIFHYKSGKWMKKSLTEEGAE